MTVIHSCATKDWVKKQIRIHGVQAVIGLENATKSDAFRLIDESPYEFLIIGSCNNRNPDGSCAGHPKESL